MVKICIYNGSAYYATSVCLSKFDDARLVTCFCLSKFDDASLVTCFCPSKFDDASLVTYFCPSKFRDATLVNRNCTPQMDVALKKLLFYKRPFKDEAVCSAVNAAALTYLKFNHFKKLFFYE